MQTPGAGPDEASHDQQEQPGNGLSRRGLMRSAAGVGAATVAAGFLASALADPAVAASRPDAVPTTTEPVVAHVSDARTGQIDLFVGTRHVRVHDHELAARLIRAVRQPVRPRVRQ
ncbi:MAG TPA: hypothetical protein VFX16_07955 [Pseudonocardiaceae bacterium]|nr:hypothetical protein [Pseudonocardiaceae bacterium]